jgi:hypothetical protein
MDANFVIDTLMMVTWFWVLVTGQLNRVSDRTDSSFAADGSKKPKACWLPQNDG